MAIVVPITVLVSFALFVRWGVSLYSYSGAGKPPMFGDYEAQRHWMEVTYHLPVKDWYVEGLDNDLQYWGLDYPPLTAYHSWLCGLVADKINSSWVELHKSRGIESLAHKLFMRYSVVVADLLVYIPAVVAYIYTTRWIDSQKQMLATVALLFYPGLLLIDHGHFQYNSVSLGLTLWGVVGLSSGHDLVGSICFTLALNYKQMELYHAVPFFCYLLGSCFKASENGFMKLVKLGVVVLATFTLCWFPFLWDRQLLLQVLHRLFPFSRGLYEDKVANFWCSLSVMVKLKELLSVQSLVKVCLGTTAAALSPSSVHLLLNPSIKSFKIALVNVSLVFFLFSFQVHEKSILLVTLPVCLLLPEHPLPCLWFLWIATFSMLPLLVKDGLLAAYIATGLLFYFLLEEVHGNNKSTSSMIVWPQDGSTLWATCLKLLFVCSVMGSVMLTIASQILHPPSRYPDIFPVLISVYSCGHFIVFLIYFHWLQFRTSGQKNIPSISESQATKSDKLKRKKKKVPTATLR